MPPESTDAILSEEVDTAHPVPWIHEYVHTLQTDLPSGEMEWTTEATATYLSYKIAYENGLISPAVHDAHLARGYDAGLGDNWSTTLASADEEDVAYHRGAAVFAKLDADLQDSDISIYDVFAWLFSDSETTYGEFETYLQSEANLSAETVAAYEPLIFDNATIDEQYKSSLSESAPHLLFVGAVLLFHPLIQLLSGLILSIAMTVQTLRIASTLADDWLYRHCLALISRGSLR